MGLKKGALPAFYCAPTLCHIAPIGDSTDAEDASIVGIVAGLFLFCMNGQGEDTDVLNQPSAVSLPARTFRDERCLSVMGRK